MMSVAFNLNAFLREAEAEGVVVAFCPQLNIYSQGRTAEEARAALKSAVSLWVRNCYQRSVLEPALHELGFTRMDPDAAEDGPGTIVVRDEPGEEYGDKFEFEVPLYLLGKNSGGEASI